MEPGCTVQPVLGTMSFAGKTGLKSQDAAAVLSLFQSFAQSTSTVCELDSARLYAMGQTEKLLGQLKACAHARVATKAHPWGKQHKLDGPGLSSQLLESLKSLGVKRVDLFYLHGPCAQTPLRETVQAVQRLYSAGKFAEWGLSNYTAEQVAAVCEMCEECGWEPPRAYQGMYNGVTRAVEAELMPLLRARGIRFYCFNPLAGGLLTGKHLADKPSSGRFTNRGTRAMYCKRYWRDGILAGVAQFLAACEEHGIGAADAALRWLCHHSALDGSCGDRVILGGSSLQQYEANLTSMRAGQLPVAITDAMDRAWGLAEAECPPYWR